ncbi:hypothetical protein JCM12825_08270 [Desulfurobacterium crinifex]
MWKRMLPILISLKVLLFNFNVSFASEAELLQRIEKLEKELAELKAQLAKERIKNRRRLQKIETAVKSSKIRWYGNLRTIGSFFDTDGTNSFLQSFPHTQNLEVKEKTERWLTRFRLNGIARFNDFTFHMRISTYYLWGDRDRMDYFPYLTTGRIPHGGTELFLERAYVDWKLPSSSAVLSVGRLPVGGGPPCDFKEDSVRKSVYPAIFFDSAMDGIILSVPLEKITGIKHSGFRLGYGKPYQSDVEPVFYFQRGEVKDIRALFLMFESPLPEWVGDDTLFVGGFSYLWDIPNALDVNNVYTYDPKTGEVIPLNETRYSVGDLEAIGIHIQAKKFLYSNFDTFLSLGFTRTKPAPKYDEDDVVSILGSTDEKTGWAVYTGFRYNFNRMNKVGFEFNHGSKYWLTFSQAPEDLVGKLSVNGNVYETYFIHRFTDRIMSRLGFIYLDYDYLMGIPTWATQPIKTDFNIKTFYGLLDFRF